MVLACACSNTKYLKGNQQLYTGATVKIESTGKVPNKKELKNELSGLLRPEPNSSFLGLKIKLWAYNIAGNPTGKGLRYWLKYKFGEPPVLASLSAFEKNRAILQNRLENRGYFGDTVTFDTSVKSRRAYVTYTAAVRDQYQLGKVTFKLDSSELGKGIARTTRRSRLRPGNPYDLETIKEERTRIDNRLKQKGFYYFNEDYLLAKADSTVGDSKVDIAMQVKPEMPTKAGLPYRINDIYVYTDYDARDTAFRPRGTTHIGGYTIIDPEHKFKPQIFNRTLIFDSGDLYNREAHNLSLNRLTTLGVFKYVKARFREVPNAKQPLLNVYYYLTPTEKKSIRFEASALTKSNNANGGEVSVNWRHRNLLKGAELFVVSTYAGLEQQLSGQGNIATRRIGATVSISVPRLITPFVQFNTNSGFVPKTKAELGYEIYNRSNQYTLTSSKATFGYIFKESAQKEHTLNLVSINYVKPTDITPEFQAQLDTNITLARSIERQFIIGTNYNFNLNTQINPNRKRNNFYFNGNIDLSGNLLGAITGANIDKGKERQIFNTPFSQYTKLEADFRHYLSFGKFNQFVSRITAGVGFAYGNSSTLPFIKQFFAGGVNDIRAFRSRSLGPGTYYAGNRAEVGFLPDQPGDVKIEMNAEYRAKLFSIVRGALFIDAGNIWTRQADTARRGSQFSKDFLKEMAVGVGAGLRFDISILILRLDLAFPIRKPWLPENERWVIKNIDLGNSKWRKDNLVFNLAIGYPF
ncbi:surface antigen [Filimonas lacunae]|nr:surface antigen [Filimonas lacunae]